MAWATSIQSKFSQKIGDPVPEYYSDTPIHSALVHFPIAFNTLAWGLDVLYALTTTFIKPGVLTSRFGSDNTLLDISRLSYFLLCTGLITTVPAIMTGNIMLVGMIKKNGGPWEKDAKGNQSDRMVAKIKAAITHALTMDLVFLVNLYSWYCRRSTATNVNVGNVPSGTNMFISATLFPMLLASAKIGGTLVYNHGIGLKLGRKTYKEVNRKPGMECIIDKES